MGKVEYVHSGTAKDNGSHLSQTFHLPFKQGPVLFSLAMLLSAVWCYTPTKSNDTGFNHLNPVSCQGVLSSNREIMAYLDFLHKDLKRHKGVFM